MLKREEQLSPLGATYRNLSEEEKEKHRKIMRERMKQKRQDPEYNKKILASNREYQAQKTFEFRNIHDEMLPEDFKEVSEYPRRKYERRKSYEESRSQYKKEYDIRKKLEEENPRYKKYIQKLRND